MNTLKDAHERILFVRNLPYKLTSQEMYDVFGRYGPIRQIRVGTEKETKGTGFVVYIEITDAKKAQTELNGYCMSGRYLIVLPYQSSKVKKVLEEKEDVRTNASAPTTTNA